MLIKDHHKKKILMETVLINSSHESNQGFRHKYQSTHINIAYRIGG